MIKELAFGNERQVFSYRAAAIIVANGKVLLERYHGSDEYTVPGGHINFEESAADALKRECLEEMGVEVTVGPLLSVGDVIYSWEIVRISTLTMFFNVTLPETTPFPTDGFFEVKDEIGDDIQTLEFCWIPLEDLRDTKLVPAEIKEWIMDPSLKPDYFISRN